MEELIQFLREKSQEITQRAQNAQQAAQIQNEVHDRLHQFVNQNLDQIQDVIDITPSAFSFARFSLRCRLADMGGVS